jgi:hypothetical protein
VVAVAASDKPMTKKARMKPSLTPSQIESMRAVAEGADVLAYGIACDLRKVQELHPGLVTITARMGRYKATEQLPYFGAILTERGRIAAGIDKRCTRCPRGENLWPATTDFFRPQPKPGNPTRLAPWCRSCEAEQKASAKRALTGARAVIARANRAQA